MARPVASTPGCYVHVPFCARRCDYCAFSTFTDRAHLVDAYVEACVTDLARTRARLGIEAFSTVFLGGGTPSLLAPEHLVALLSAARARAASEVTIECNPESVSAELLAAVRSAGATRISLGVQSLVPHVLSGLGRHQEPGSVAAALSAVREAGFSRYSVDLVFGGAGESDADFSATLAELFLLAPDLSHVSCYALTVEQGTPLARDPRRHPDDDVCATRYELADELLRERGLCWYEISNFAVPGHECEHNQSCWRAGEYVAIGSAAHGHLGGVRFANLSAPERYIAAVRAGRSPVARVFSRSRDEVALESLELALRTREGVPLGALDLSDLALVGLVERAGDRVVLTRRGRLLANEVAIRLRTGPSGPPGPQMSAELPPPVTSPASR